MEKKINGYRLLLCAMLFPAGAAIAQTTGVQTRNPSAPLHIDAAKDNSATPTAAQIQNDVVVTADGNLGVGLLSPVTKVDLRSGTDYGIIGMGTDTAQTAAAAGTGAIRYNTAGYLEYSDGVDWLQLAISPPTKVLITAKNSATNVSVAPGTTSSTTITGWTVDATSVGASSFSNGVFTAPRDGFYFCTFSVTFGGSTSTNTGAIRNNTYIETALESNETTNNIQTFKSVNSYPAFQATVISNIMNGGCNGIFNLKAGDTVKFTVKISKGLTSDTAGNRFLYSADNGIHNNLSISEL